VGVLSAQTKTFPVFHGAIYTFNKKREIRGLSPNVERKLSLKVEGGNLLPISSPDLGNRSHWF